MTIKRVLYTFVFSLVFVFAAEIHSAPDPNDQNIITVNYPPDRSVMELDLLGISLGIPQGSVDLITAKLNDEREIKIVPDSIFECFSVLLSLGVNRIDITALKKGRTVDEITLQVFRRSEIESAYKNPPAGFKKSLFHEREGLQCTPCHVMEPAEYDKKPINIAAFAGGSSGEAGEKAASAASTCYSCHSKITSYLYVHGPASVWSCLSCHDPEKEPMYATEKPDNKVCFGCHAEQKKDWGSRQYIHGPVNIGSCAICHSPHASENRFNLVKPTWKLCVGCHADKGTGRHIFGGTVSREGHPTHGKPDPARVGKELTCASCHNPHASDFPKLWAFNAQSPLELCKICHTEYFR